MGGKQSVFQRAVTGVESASKVTPSMLIDPACSFGPEQSGGDGSRRSARMRREQFTSRTGIDQSSRSARDLSLSRNTVRKVLQIYEGRIPPDERNVDTPEARSWTEAGLDRLPTSKHEAVRPRSGRR